LTEFVVVGRLVSVKIQPNRYYAVKEIAGYFEVVDQTIVNAINRGQLVATKLMNTWRIKGEWVLAFEKEAVAHAKAIRKSLPPIRTVPTPRKVLRSGARPMQKGRLR